MRIRRPSEQWPEDTKGAETSVSSDGWRGKCRSVGRHRFLEPDRAVQLLILSERLCHSLGSQNPDFETVPRQPKF
jgi:hypothetical protein